MLACVVLVLMVSSEVGGAESGDMWFATCVVDTWEGALLILGQLKKGRFTFELDVAVRAERAFLQPHFSDCLQAHQITRGRGGVSR